MGYNTSYELTTVEQPEHTDCPHCGQKMPGYKTFKERVEEIAEYGVFDEECKWYEHEKDIARAMRETGTTLVIIHGEGEEQGDVWDKRFTYDGNHVACEESKYELKPVSTKSKQVRL